MADVMTYNGQQLVRQLKPRIDTASDPLAKLYHNQEWQHAIDELRIIMSNQRQWDTINTIQPGSQSNHVLLHIGKQRLAWLRQFCVDELGYRPPRSGGNGN